MERVEGFISATENNFLEIVLVKIEPLCVVVEMDGWTPTGMMNRRITHLYCSSHVLVLYSSLSTTST